MTSEIVGQTWVLCAEDSGKYLRSDCVPIRWVETPFEATVFDSRDSREIKTRFLSIVSGQKLVALDY